MRKNIFGKGIAAVLAVALGAAALTGCGKKPAETTAAATTAAATQAAPAATQAAGQTAETQAAETQAAAGGIKEGGEATVMIQTEPDRICRQMDERMVENLLIVLVEPDRNGG